MRHDKATMNHQRKVLALTGVLLPILAPLMGFIAYERNGPEFWYSISATFYASSNIFMIGVLAIFAFFLITYKGYDIGDNCTTTFSAVMAIGILIFPCASELAGKTTGVFNLPAAVSHATHCFVAALLFGSFAFMIGARFTKTDGEITKEKRKRNRIYKGCALAIVTAMAMQVLTSLIGVKWFTIINETIMLWAFSLAWAVKAGCFKKLLDK